MFKLTTNILPRVARSLFGDSPLVPKIVHEGRKVIGKDQGTHSIALWPVVAALRKLKGKDKVNSVIYDKYLRKVQNADDNIGKVLAQHGPRKIFTAKEIVPTTRKIKGNPAHVEYEGYKASAPVTRVMKVVTPLSAGMYLSSLGSKKEGFKDMKKDPKQLMKQAADEIERFRKREEATKLAFELVEKGKCEPYGTYQDFETKIASLLEKDLEVVREAMEMDGELADFGKIASEENTSSVKGFDGATDRFFARLST